MFFRLSGMDITKLEIIPEDEELHFDNPQKQEYQKEKKSSTA